MTAFISPPLPVWKFTVCGIENSVRSDSSTVFPHNEILLDGQILSHRMRVTGAAPFHFFGDAHDERFDENPQQNRPADGEQQRVPRGVLAPAIYKTKHQC